MGGVFVCKVRHSLTIGQLRALLDILSRGGGFGEQPQQAFSRPLVGAKIAGVATPALLAGSASLGKRCKNKFSPLLLDPKQMVFNR